MRDKDGSYVLVVLLSKSDLDDLSFNDVGEDSDNVGNLMTSLV